MPLRLVRLDHPHPLYEVRSGDVIIGRIEELIGPTEGWTWSVTGGGSGLAATKAEAKKNMALAWRVWLRRAALEEVGGAPTPDRVALVIAGRGGDPFKVQMVMNPILGRYQWNLLIHGCNDIFGRALDVWASGACTCRRMPQCLATLEALRPIVVIVFSLDETIEPLLTEARKRGIKVHIADPPIWPERPLREFFAAAGVKLDQEELMCGRVRDPEEFSELKIRIDKYHLEPRERRSNVPPTSIVPVVTSGPDAVRVLEPMRWGLVPPWARDQKLAHATFNARADSITTKPAFRGAWKAGRRCLIITGGFYEWRKADKQPFAVSLGNRGTMPMAGLWETWRGPDGPVKSCTIITTEANAMMTEVHDRMPVILGPDDWPAWLGEEEATPDQLLGMLRPYPPERMTMWPVSKAVGNVRNTGPELEEAIPL